MAVRQIDANVAMKKIREYMEDFPNAHTRLAACRVILSMLGDENQIPTLTPPNETPPCYQPDGDGCAYQCYDGDDEPIDKCKECPLCYSDKQRHHAPPNEPLTLEQLREMDGEPVWVLDLQEPGHSAWRLIYWSHGKYLVFISKNMDGYIPEEYGVTWLAYCRPPV